jgi:hypothetical protein
MKIARNKLASEREKIMSDTSEMKATGVKRMKRKRSLKSVG